jgi:hypothetical protein
MKNNLHHISRVHETANRLDLCLQVITTIGKANFSFCVSLKIHFTQLLLVVGPTATSVETSVGPLIGPTTRLMRPTGGSQLLSKDNGCALRYAQPKLTFGFFHLATLEKNQSQFVKRSQGKGESGSAGYAGPTTPALRASLVLPASLSCLEVRP